MAEAAMRQRIVKELKILHAISVENPINPGTPDINYADGFIECKWLRHWPKREGTIVKLLCDLSKEQRLWINLREKAGGIVWVMLQCRREWLLFHGETAAKHIGKATRAELYELAYQVWTDGLNRDELVRILSARPT